MNIDRNTSGLDRLKARRYMLENQLCEIKNRITGRNTGFYPFITDRSGKISERKLSHFINELLDGPQKYGRHNMWFGFNGFPELRELCECFLYCAIQGIAVYNEGEKYAVRPARFFSDITDIAMHKNNLFLTDINTLHKYEFDSAVYDGLRGESIYFTEFNEGGFFRNSDMAYYILTGNHIVSTFPADEYKQLSGAYEFERAKEQGFDSAEDYGRAMNKAENELQNADIDKLLDDIEYVPYDKSDMELIELQERKNEEWKKTVVCPEKFAEKYLRFRELYFKLGMFYRYHLFEEIELMVDVFLYEHKLSAFSEEDIFAMIYYRTDKLSASMERSAAKEVNES